MEQSLAIRKTVSMSLDLAIERATNALKEVGFGILTRIDFDQKIKEKLEKELPRTVILGACNPALAYEAYRQNTDVTLLIPCNLVVREIANGQCAIEMIRPSQMMQVLPGIEMQDMVTKAEAALLGVLSNL